MNELGAFALIIFGFYALIERKDPTMCAACLGWACALHNRVMLTQLRKDLGK